MENGKIGVLPVYLPPDDKPFNFHAIKDNAAAQEWLLKHSQTMSPEQLFEAVYQIQQEYGEEMMRRKAARMEKDPNRDPGFFKTPEEEWNRYDDIAKEMTMKAMVWLKKHQQAELKQNKKDSLGGDIPL